MKDIKKFNVESEISEYQVVNPNFAKVLVKIAYADKNRNKSDIPKDSFEKASGTLPYVPIVGHYLENEEMFGGHDEEVIETDEGIKTKPLTIPYGVVSNEQPFWRSFKELDGSFKDYYCCYGYLWIGRYPELEGIKTGDYKQSMEITVNNSKSENGYIVIKDFTFDALCILERDEPCFEGSIITTNFSVNNFQKDYKEMVDELKKYTLETLKEEEGGNKIMKRTEIISKFSTLSKVEGYKAIIDNSNLSDEDLEKELFALSQNQLNQFINESLSTVKIIKQYWDGESYETQKYWLEDVIISENIAILWSREDYKNYGVTYSMTGDKVTLDFANIKRYVVGDWRQFEDGQAEPINPMETFASDIIEQAKTTIDTVKNSFNVKETEEFKTLEGELETKDKEIEAFKVNETKLTNDLDKVKADYTTLNSNFASLEQNKTVLDEEIKTLKQFKADKEQEFKEAQVDEVLAKFTELENVEGYEEIVKEKFNLTLEELEVKLKVFAFDNNIVIGGKQKFSTKNEKSITNLPLEGSKPNNTYTGAWSEIDDYLPTK